MIAQGIKKEEYRAIKPYWDRIFSSTIKIKNRHYHPTDVVILFSNGFSKDRSQILIECKGLVQRFGKPEWGANEGEQYHVLLLGEIQEKINTRTCN